jgi:hypothetical protein
LDAAENSEIINYLNFEILKPYLPIILFSAAFIGSAFFFKGLDLGGVLGNGANYLGKSIGLLERTLTVSGKDSSLNDVILKSVENIDGSSTIQILFGAGQEVLDLGLLVANFTVVEELREQLKFHMELKNACDETIRDMADLITRKVHEIECLRVEISELKAQISNSALEVVSVDPVSAARVMEELARAIT